MPERKARAHAAVQAASQKIEKMLGSSPAYRKVEDGLYAVKQGSSMIMIKVHTWKDHALIRLVAQLVKGVSMECMLAVELLQLNAVLRFGAFAFVPEGQAIVLCHTLLDRDLGDKEEFTQTIRDFAFVADEYDDRIAARYGGQTMEDLMEESVLARMRQAGGPDPG
jgi:hypothetical protein